uniref:Uncharacterized protein n=1 Tax=Picea glauca TaxID=3330 RepID=A0A101M0S0_PICGL|nr:hypothetical protein ABT39_MTgene4116 [Picea glauca]QHR92563.1 hypothetical protein Q903MT_gene6609 [Picea sitchensis]
MCKWTILNKTPQHPLKWSTVSQGKCLGECSTSKMPLINLYPSVISHEHALMLFFRSAYRWLRALDGVAFHRFQCLLLPPLTGPSLLLPPLAHHMDLHQEPDMELSLLYVLNPISLRDRGELVPASELASYPVDRADANELVYSVSPVEASVGDSDTMMEEVTRMLNSI